MHNKRGLLLEHQMKSKTWVTLLESNAIEMHQYDTKVDAMKIILERQVDISIGYREKQ